MKVTIIIIKLLFLGALFIISNHELYLSEINDREVFFNMYYDWIDGIFSQTLSVTAYVAKFEWLPETNQSYIQK